MTNPKRIYYPDGDLHSEKWHLNNKLHREDGPAYIRYNPSGKIDYEEWHLNGKLHRTDGPSFIIYNHSERISFQKWYLHGKEIYPYEWLKENRYKWPLNKEKEIEFLLRFA